MAAHKDIIIKIIYAYFLFQVASIVSTTDVLYEALGDTVTEAPSGTEIDGLESQVVDF